MAKRTFIVTDANGIQHTRKTDRVYTHAVAVLDSYTFDLAQVDKIWDIDRVNFDYYVKIVDTNGVYGASKIYDSYNAEQIANVEAANARHLENAQEIVNRGVTRDGYAELRRAERVARIEEKKAKGDYEKWGILGFNGRLDLAQKAASAAQGARYAQVVILEAHLKG